MEETTISARSMNTIIKLKDKPNRGGAKFNLKAIFGFQPDEIVIQKVHGQNNSFILSAVLTQEQLDKENLDNTGKPKEEKSKIVQKKIEQIEGR